jgi:putative transposase
LSEAERARIIAIANEPRFAETPPARIVPALADEGIYIASESSFHRVLRAHGQMNRRGRAQPPRTSRPPTTHIATGPGDVWCWDVTFLPAQIQGRWFYFYLILDLYSRKIVGFEVHDTDSAEHAAHLARRTALAEQVHAMPVRPVLHGDNGATLKATTVLAMLHWLGIKPSYSRPRVSDDNAFAEALFRTAKYRPEFPIKGFADLHTARQWAMRFVQWYNDEHRHSGIRYVTPAQRHAGQDGRILAARHVVYQDARSRNPQRWSGQTRNWKPVGVVTLNPERDIIIRAATSQILLSGSIGEPAFPSRPGSAEAAERNAGDGRSRATRSHAQPSVPTTVRHLSPGSLDPEDAEGSPRSCPCSPFRIMPTRVPPRTAAIGRRSSRHPRRRPRNYRPARAGGRSPRGTSCASSPRRIRRREPAISARSSVARGSIRRPCATGAGNATPERLAR